MYIAGYIPPAVFLIATGYVNCNAALAVFFIVSAIGWSGIAGAGVGSNHLDLAPPYAGLYLLFALANLGSISILCYLFIWFDAMTAQKQIMSRLTKALTGMQKYNKLYTIHCDKQKRNKNIETVDYAESNVKRLRSLMYNRRLNEESQLKSSSDSGKVFQQRTIL